MTQPTFTQSVTCTWHSDTLSNPSHPRRPSHNISRDDNPVPGYLSNECARRPSPAHPVPFPIPSPPPTTLTPPIFWH